MPANRVIDTKGINNVALCLKKSLSGKMEETSDSSWCGFFDFGQSVYLYILDSIYI